MVRDFSTWKTVWIRQIAMSLIDLTYTEGEGVLLQILKPSRSKVQHDKVTIANSEGSWKAYSFNLTVGSDYVRHDKIFCWVAQEKKTLLWGDKTCSLHIKKINANWLVLPTTTYYKCCILWLLHAFIKYHHLSLQRQKLFLVPVQQGWLSEFHSLLRGFSVIQLKKSATYIYLIRIVHAIWRMACANLWMRCKIASALSDKTHICKLSPSFKGDCPLVFWKVVLLTSHYI